MDLKVLKECRKHFLRHIFFFLILFTHNYLLTQVWYWHIRFPTHQIKCNGLFLAPQTPDDVMVQNYLRPSLFCMLPYFIYFLRLDCLPCRSGEYKPFESKIFWILITEGTNKEVSCDLGEWGEVFWGDVIGKLLL